MLDAENTQMVVETCLAQAPQDEPRGFLSYADLFGQLKRRDALAGRNEQIHGIDPVPDECPKPRRAAGRKP